jgi:hypothetical protein
MVHKKYQGGGGCCSILKLVLVGLLILLMGMVATMSVLIQECFHKNNAPTLEADGNIDTQQNELVKLRKQLKEIKARAAAQSHTLYHPHGRSVDGHSRTVGPVRQWKWAPASKLDNETTALHSLVGRVVRRINHKISQSMPILDASGGEGAGMVIHQNSHVARVKNQGSAGNGGNKATDGASIGGVVWDSSISGLEVLVEILVDRDRGSGTSDNLVAAPEDGEERSPSQNHLQIPRRLHQIWVRSISNAPQTCSSSFFNSFSYSSTKPTSIISTNTSPHLTAHHLTAPLRAKPCHTQSDLNSTDLFIYRLVVAALPQSIRCQIL